MLSVLYPGPYHGHPIFDYTDFYRLSRRGFSTLNYRADYTRVYRDGQLVPNSALKIEDYATFQLPRMPNDGSVMIDVAKMLENKKVHALVHKMYDLESRLITDPDSSVTHVRLYNSV